MSVVIISNAGGGGGVVDSVTAGDLSIVVGGTATNPTIETGTLDEIATLHPPAGNWSNNSKKITALANGSGAQDAAAFGQIGTAVAVETARAEAAEALLVPLSDLPLSVANGGTGQVTAVAGFNALNPNAAPAAFRPANPTGTASTTLVMAGVGATCAYTPASSGVVSVNVTGQYQSNTGTAIVTIGGRYGTGTAPANGAAVTGTRWGGAADAPLRGPGVGLLNTFAMTDVLALTPGTAYWFDLAFDTATAADLALLTNISMTITELPAGSTGGTAVATPVPISVGGTGQATAAAALAALGGTPGLVSVQTLAAPAASITFSAIPGTYSQIRLIVVGASSTAAEATRWKVLVNGDSGSDYDIQGVVGAGNNVNAGADNAAATQQWIAASGGSGLDLPGANATAGVAGILEVVIPAYAATTLQKTGLWRSGYIDGATGVTSADAGVWGQVVAWRSTAAITSLVIEAAAGNLITGTTALLYLT
jgi:hypothetical protein